MLTDIALKALKPAPKPYKRSDGGGLFIFVKPNGGKFWSLGCNVNGKQKFFSGGSYPTASLREARDWRAAIKAQLPLGLEPNARPKPRNSSVRCPPISRRPTASRLWRWSGTRRGSVEMAHRVKNHCSEVFRYAIPDGRCQSDPCRDLAPAMAKPKPTQHRAKAANKDLPDFFVASAGLFAFHVLRARFGR